MFPPGNECFSRHLWQTIVAEETSYSVINGEVFTDGIERKVINHNRHGPSVLRLFASPRLSIA